MEPAPKSFDVICLSHLRWDFVTQRPQHLLSRFGAAHRVFFVEEPIEDATPPHLELRPRGNGVQVVVPHLPGDIQDLEAREAVIQSLMERLFTEQDLREHVLWIYTPMALPWTQHAEALAIVYDCMDELSGFLGAPKELRDREARLLKVADLVFTGGQSLFESKRHQHPHVHAFPSSIDAEHFRQARTIRVEPPDQVQIPHPRLGFFGVIDERMDLDLLARVAELRPYWHFVMVGPIVKIDPGILPRRSNLHYLGGKPYEALPSYLAGWDIAMMPFARNDATRFISPTKTPEYLAAGCPVVSTSIRDVVRCYGEAGLVHIADTPMTFVDAASAAMSEDAAARMERVDAFLADTSWDSTWRSMSDLLGRVVAMRRGASGGINP